MAHKLQQTAPSPQRRAYHGSRENPPPRHTGSLFSAIVSLVAFDSLRRKLAFRYLFSFLLVVSGRAETVPSESFYVRNDPKNETVIIFVHGVTGDSRSTWTSDRTHHFWPDMLKGDPAFIGMNIFMY